MSIAYCHCVYVGLGIQHAMRIRHIVTACLTIQYFSALSHKWDNFLKEGTEYEMSVLIFSRNFVRNIFHSKNN